MIDNLDNGSFNNHTDSDTENADLHTDYTYQDSSFAGVELNENVDFNALMQNKKTELFFKRAFDIFCSFCGIICLSPWLILIAILIKADDKGTVFFRQERIGRNGKPFRIYKFRTMVSNAETLGLSITVGDDRRVTNVGRFLRRTKIDELPQLFNVLVGDMSFVGPRPEVKRYVDLYTPYERNVLRIRPGITEEASIVYRNESDILAKSMDPERTYIEEIMPAKIRININYMLKMGLWYDIKMILKTLVSILD